MTKLEMRLKLIKPDRDAPIVLSDHDIHLPHLGPMCFMMSPTHDNGATLYYVKKKDLLSFESGDGWRRGIPVDYYCSYKVKRNALDNFLGKELDTKIYETIPRFKRWVIDQDTFLGELLGSRRHARI